MLNLYTETAFQGTPPTPSSRLDFQIPRRNGSYDKSKGANRGQGLYPRDERSFSKQILASSAEIYFRQAKSYPRTFLWKVIADRVLQIQCADLSRSESDTREAYLTISFGFQDDILPAGVAFTDAENEHELHIFVGTNRNEIYHLQIPMNAFRTPEAISQDISNWSSPMDISSLAIETAFRIYANTPYELFVSFTSGKLQRLRRKADNNHWVPEHYDDKTWGASIRGIVGRARIHTIDFGTMQLDSRVVQGMVASADGNYLFTICLNHQLRVWHLATGRLAVSKDLLDIEREPQDRIQLNPADKGFLQLVKLPLHRHPILVTFSPHEGGQFKFWDVKGGLTEPLSLEDRYPGATLSPPDPDPSGNTVWSMTGFKLSPGTDFKPARLWVLWRNNNYHQLYTNHFEFGDLARTWSHSWVACSTDVIKKPSPPDLLKSDPTDPTSKWMDFLFQPDLYTPIVLETALAIYQEAVSAKLPSSMRATSLAQRLCALVAATTSLRKYDDSAMDYERFAADTDYQWRNFWRIVENINDGRRAPVAFSYDLFSEMAWVVMTDMCCAVRECSKIELSILNDTKDVGEVGEKCAAMWPYRRVSTDNEESFEDVTQLITAARTFRMSFTAELVKDLTTAIEEEILVNPDLTTVSRIYELYDNVSFGDAVSNETFHKLENDMESVGGLRGLNSQLFTAALQLVDNPGSAKPASALRSTMFGSQLLSAGTVNCLHATRQLLWDLFALIIFIEGELNQEEEKMAAFDAVELIAELAPLLKTQERNLWLATHFRLVPLDFLGASRRRDSSRDQKELSLEHGRVVSILEDSLAKAVRPQPVVERSLMYHITDTLQEIQEWTSGQREIALDEGSVYLQCDLLEHHDIDLATEFLRFQPSTAWSTYIKGRLFLMKANADMAAQYFRKAAYGLSCGKAVGDLNELSAGLVTVLETESFNNGLPRYFQHVSTLFESSKEFVQSTNFARLALSSLTPGTKEPTRNFRTEILSRLFTAELKTCQFEAAFGALAQFSDQALQKSCAASLISAILDLNTSTASTAGVLQTLQRLPWSLHPTLSRQLDHQLSSLAKKQKSIVTSPGQWTTATSDLDYLKIVHALRISQNDYRGAVSILFDRLRLIQRSGAGRRDPQATALRHALLALINAMTCIAPEEAYILTEGEETPKLANGTQHEENGDVVTNKRRRVIVTLADLRKEYQQVLDRCSRIERGDFDFDVDSESDVDDDMDVDRSRVHGVGRQGDAMEF